MALDPKVLSDIYGDNGVLANPFPTAKEYQPEQMAQGIKIGRAKGMDAMLVADHLPQLHDELDQDHWNEIVKNSPKLAKQMQEPAFAAVAHDDTQNLSTLEKTVSFAKNIGRSIPAGVASFNEGMYGFAQSVTDLGAAAISPLVGTILPANPFTQMSDAATNRRVVEKANKTALEKARGKVGPTEGAIYSGIESGVQNLLMLPVAIASRNPSLLAGTMAAQTEGQGYGDAIDAGKTPAQALPFAVSQGYVEYATEQIPALKLLNGLKAKAPAMQIAKDFLAKEIPGEQVATALQDLNEWATLHPEKPFTEYLKDRPGAAYQTLVATIVGGGVQVGAGKAIEHVVNRFSPSNVAEENAQQDHQTLTQLDQLAAESKVKARDPVTFQQFVADATQDGPVQDVYIDAKVLAQSGIAQELAQVSPAISAQFNDAIQTGGSVRIPLDEYAANIAGTEFNQGLLEHLKTDPNGMTFAESKEYAKTYQEDFNAELDKVTQEHTGDEAFKASAATVQNEILKQLNETGRYTPEVNDTNAMVAGAHFAVRAAQLGMTPEELYKLRPLKVNGEPILGDSYNQDGALQTDTNNFKNWFADSKVVDAEGKPQVVYHGTDKPFTKVNMKKGAQGVFWVTSNKQALEDGEIGAAGNGTIMSLYANIKNPAGWKEYDQLSLDEIEHRGYDGVVLPNKDGTFEAIIFDPKQVKSATKNKGTFDPNDPNILHQSTPEQKGIAKLFKALTENDAVFQYGKSTATDMQQVFDDIVPGTVKVDLAIAPEGIDEQYTVFPVDAMGKVLRDQEGTVSVYPDGKVEINVLNWEKGYGGSGIYAAVGNWAFNNNKVFSGDREGITPTGKMRRLENMISLALKFGTTDHIAPHPEQMHELGFDWKTGDTEYNLEQMLLASYKAIRNGTYITESRFGTEVTHKSPNARGVAKLDDLAYDFDKHQFIELSSGKQYTDKQFAELAKTKGARDVAAGRTTLERAALAHTFLSGMDERSLERLSQLAHQSLANTQLEKRFYQNNTNTRGSFSPSSNTITLLKNADLSTFLHELGHSFLEMDVNLAAQLSGNTQLTEGEQEILNDVGSLFNWFGLQGNISAQLDQWYAMTLDEQRTYHEQMAEGFESYLFEGKAPSIELQPLFQRMRAWFMHVYRNLSKYLSDAGESLTPEVRSVFDRMLASTEQIKLSQQARSMLPLFETADQAGMTPDEFAAYQRLDPQATQDAIAELQSRGLRDMKWLSNARAKQLKKLQKEADGLRREVRSEVTTEIMSQPVYRAWTFLTAKLSADDKLTPGIRLKSDPNIVDETQDNIFTAIAKLGGINKDAAISEWGIDPRDNPQSGVFGKPVLRKQGGLALDAMAELLAERGYLPVDKNGKHDIRDLEERYSEQARGNKQVSQAYDYSQDQAQLPGAELNTDALKAGRLDRSSLAETYGTAEGSPIAGLNTLRMTSTTGLHPDIVAEMFGFSSGDQLVKALLDAQPPKQAVEDATDTRMLERHGDLSSPEALGRAADKAIHNDVRARMISTELNALAKATGKKATLASAAREFATAMIARIKVRNIKPNQYAVAEAKAAKNAAAAMRKSGLETAAAEKRNQLVNNYATKAALNARDEIDQGVAYLRKFGSDGVRKSIDVDYLDQIDAMLERFDLRTGVSLKTLDKRTALLEWMNKQRDQGMEPDIPSELMNEAVRMSYKDMTLEAFRGLVDSVKQIDHLGRLKNRLLTAKDQRTYEAIRDIITTSIIENAGDRKANTRTPTTNTGRAIQSVKNFWASHLKASIWARIMDGGQDGGPVWEYFIRSANEAANFETHERGTATEALSKILAPVFKLGKMGGKGQYFASIDRSLNRESRMAIALNTGNASNYQRLLGGEGWTAQQVQPVVDSLTKAEWDAVQAIWDHFETYRPQIAAKERRVYGKEPNWVEATAVHTAHGEYRGGYYPIKYDPNASQRAEEHVDAEGAKRQLQGAYTSATTRRSFTKTRVDEVNGRPLLYTLAGVYSGVNDVIHDLAWHEWLIDVNRLMRSSTIDSAIRDHYGPEVKRQLKTWIQDIAEGERGADNAGEMVLGKLRQGVSIAGLGFNVLSAAIQITGFNQSIVRVGAKWIGRGITKYLASPIQSTREVTEQSEFMADRFRTQFRELNELRNSVQDQSAAKRVLQDGAYFMMTRVQQMVDVPTWLGAYEKAISDGNAEERAVSLADQAVIEAQMSGMSKDLSKIERGGPALKLFTVFYSFMNTSFNLGVMKAMTEKNKAKLAADFLLLYVAGPVLTLALKNALTPGDADDDWDFEALAKALLGESLGFLMGQMVVVREFAEAGKNALGLTNGNFGYQGPAGVRVIADTTKFVQQAQQGEFDDSFRKASINLIGPLFGLPAAQVNRSITGINALTDGKTDNPAAAILGYQEPH